MNLKIFTPTTACRLMLALFLALFSMMAQAQTFFNVTANGIEWSCTVIESTTNVSIKPDYKSSIPATVTIPSTVTNGETNYTVTTIGNYAFFGSSALASITIPASVTTIGEGAFGNSGLTSVTIPANVTTIGDGAFSKSGLTSVTIPASVTSIGYRAFYNCSNLASVIMNHTNNEPAPTLGLGAFDCNAAVRKIYVTASSWSSFTSVWSAYDDDLVIYTPGFSLGTNITANKDVNSDADYWCTYYNSTYSMQVSSGVTIYKAKVNDDKTKVILTEVGGNTITMGQAVVLKSSSASISLSQKLEAAGDYSGNELKGTDVDLANPGNVYCLSNETTGSSPRGVGFYSYGINDGPVQNGVIPAHRAYLVVTGVPNTSRGFLGFGDDDGATAIDNSPLDPKGRLLPKGTQEFTIDNSDGTIYDLSGRIVTGQPRKGIYVKDGKKFVIK